MMKRTAFGQVEGKSYKKFTGETIKVLAGTLTGCESFWVTGVDFVAYVETREGSPFMEVFRPTKGLRKAVKKEGGAVKTSMTTAELMKILDRILILNPVVNLTLATVGGKEVIAK